MCKIFLGLILLLSFGLAQAQLVPKGMVLSGTSADSSEVNNAANPPFVADSEEVSVDLKTSPFHAEILGKFQQDYRHNMMKSDDFYRYSRITTWTSVGLILAGAIMLAVNANVNSPWGVGGISAIGVGIAGNILSFGFDAVSHAYRVKAGNVKKDMIKYLQDNFSIPIMQE